MEKDGLLKGDASMSKHSVLKKWCEMFQKISQEGIYVVL